MPNTLATRILATASVVVALSGVGACSIPRSGIPGSVAPATTPRQALNSDAVAVLGEALIRAATANNVAEVIKLIEAGAPVEYRGDAKRTALLAATRANSIAAARELMARGANVNAQDELQDSAFLYAGAEGLTEILRLTLEYGADVRSTNRYGGTALIPACEHAYVETVALLLDTEIDVDHINSLGWNCLLETVILGDGSADHQEVVSMLIEEDADLGVTDPGGLSALEHARRLKQSAVVRLLEDAETPR